MRKRILAMILALATIIGTLVILPIGSAAAAASTSTVTTSDSGWDGESETPEGSGTEVDPYLIASAGNLKWLSDICNTGSGQAANYTLGLNGKAQKVTSLDTEVEAYCKQVCDIDMNGKTIRSIGCYSRALENNFSTYMQYFGGHYDGQGYTIKNGIFQSNNDTANLRWHSGMFGVMIGATVENIVFDNVHNLGNQTGGLVTSAAVAPEATAANEGYSNVIRNIVIMDNCYVGQRPTNTGTSKTSAFGGVAGYAYDTLVENCKVGATVATTKTVTFMGGVVGYMGVGTYVDHCLFEGYIQYDCTLIAEGAVGGIVGYRIDTTSTTGTGTTGISYCINRGTLTTTASGSFSLGIGGIVGISNNINKNGYTHVFNNNYNLSGDTEWDASGATATTVRVGSLVGCAWISATSQTALVITECYSVAFTSTSNDSDKSASKFPSTDFIGANCKGYSMTQDETSTTGVDLNTMEKYIIPVVAEMALTTTSGGWVGAGSDANGEVPAGSGTKNDPYLIASAANLQWLHHMADGADSGYYYCPGPNGTKQVVRKNASNGDATIVSTTPEQYIYCKQVCDIDLNGNIVNSIGDYTDFGGNVTKAGYFYGEYDGQGYKIMNGMFQADNGYKTNLNWPDGMFGMLWGATVKNIVFDRIVASGSQVNGILAAYAYGKYSYDLTGDRKNIIENITVTDTCSVITRTEFSVNVGSAYGGLVGRAVHTEIRDCQVDAQIMTSGSVKFVGGIVGYLGSGALVDNCEFGGSIAYRGAFAAEGNVGGVVGLWSNDTAKDHGISGITNCINRGSYVRTGSDAKNLNVGGILGCAHTMRASDSELVFENNYNMSDLNTFQALSGTSNTIRAGEILGLCWYTTASTPVNITNCHSISWGDSLPTINGTSRADGVGLYNIVGEVAGINVINCSLLTAEEVEALAAYITAEKNGFVTLTTGWDGSSTIQPAGSGTKDDPYLIERAENLNWLANKPGGGGQRFSKLGPNHTIYYGQYYSYNAWILTTTTTVTTTTYTYAEDGTQSSSTSTSTKTAYSYTTESAAAPSDSDETVTTNNDDGTAAKDVQTVITYSKAYGLIPGGLAVDTTKEGVTRVEISYTDSDQGNYLHKYCDFTKPMISDDGDTIAWNEPIYVKQTCDIDLNGHNLISIGGYWRYFPGTDQCKGQFFNGVYDGQGYSIKNGTFSRTNNNEFWLSGLFGNVLGATIKNLTFDNITASSVGGAVAIVAARVIGPQAMTSADRAALDADTVIENITVTDTCKVNGNLSAHTTGRGSFTWRGVGGIVGNASNVTVRNCEYGGEITVNRNALWFGGIVGLLADNGIVDGCTFSGEINIPNHRMMDETHVGGIVGSWRSIYQYSAGAEVNKIVNCINKGKLRGTFAGSQVLCTGGILGATCDLDVNAAYTFDNNFNLSGGALWNHVNMNCPKRVGGIVGCFFNTASVPSQVKVTNCYSAALDPVTMSDYTSGAVIGAIRNRDTMPAVEENCAQSTNVNALPQYISFVKPMEGEHAFLGTQYKYDSATGTYALRLINGINSLNYKRLAYKVTVSNGSQIVTIPIEQTQQTKLYTSFTATVTDPVTGEVSTQVYKAEDFGYKYVSILVLKGIPADATYTISYTPTAIPLDAPDTYVDGTQHVLTFHAASGSKVRYPDLDSMQDDTLRINGNTLNRYQIVYTASDEVAYYVAQSVHAYILSATGLDLPVVTTAATSSDYEIRVGYSETGATVAAEHYSIGLDGNSLELLYSGGVVAVNMLDALKDLYLNNRDYTVDLRVNDDTTLLVSDQTVAREALILDKTVKAGFDRYNESDIRVLYQNIHGLSLLGDATKYYGYTGADQAEIVSKVMELLQSVYLGYAPDVICLQEVGTNDNHETQADMEAIVPFLLNNGYTMYRGNKGLVTADTYTEVSNDNYSGHAIPIFFKTDKFTAVDYGYDSGDRLALGMLVDGTTDKGTAWVILETAAGKQFAVLNSHFMAGNDAENNYVRNDNAVEYGEIVKSLQSAVDVIITGGDYNTTYDLSYEYDGTTYTPYATMLTYGVTNVRECEYLTSEDVTHLAPRGASISYNAELDLFNLSTYTGNPHTGAIDHVLYLIENDAATLQQYRVCTDRFSATSSDHIAHFVDFTLN